VCLEHQHNINFAQLYNIALTNRLTHSEPDSVTDFSTNHLSHPVANRLTHTEPDNGTNRLTHSDPDCVTDFKSAEPHNEHSHNHSHLDSALRNRARVVRSRVGANKARLD